MKRIQQGVFFVAAGAVAVGLLASSCSTTSPSKPTATPTKVKTATPANTNTFTVTNTNTATNTFTPSPTATGVYIYMYGGDGGAAGLSACYSALVLPSGGLGSWVSTTVLPAATTNLAYANNGTYCYVVGGVVGGAPVGTVRYSMMGGGALSAWQQASPIPTAIQLHGAAVASGRLWAWGGSGAGNAIGGVWSSMLASGLPTTWTFAAAVPTPVIAGVWGSDGSYLYHAGGTDTGSGAAVWDAAWSTIANGGGTIGSWSSGPPLPTPICYGGYLVTNGMIFSVSGSDTTWATNGSLDVWYATAAGGTIGTWATGAQLPLGLAQAGVIAAGSYMYVVGGIQDDQLTGNTCYSGLITGSGVTSWTTLANLSFDIEAQGIAVR